MVWLLVLQVTRPRLRKLFSATVLKNFLNKKAKIELHIYAKAQKNLAPKECSKFGPPNVPNPISVLYCAITFNVIRVR
jgi:hypothetical protein